nr:hypothetical protein Iba_chr12eCG0050 [Ipomoea batatas]
MQWKDHPGVRTVQNGSSTSMLIPIQGCGHQAEAGSACTRTTRRQSCQQGQRQTHRQRCCCRC